MTPAPTHDVVFGVPGGCPDCDSTTTLRLNRATGEIEEWLAHDPDCPWLNEQFARWLRDHPDQNLE